MCIDDQLYSANITSNHLYLSAQQLLHATKNLASAVYSFVRPFGHLSTYAATPAGLKIFPTPSVWTPKCPVSAGNCSRQIGMYCRPPTRSGPAATPTEKMSFDREGDVGAVHTGGLFRPGLQAGKRYYWQVFVWDTKAGFQPERKGLVANGPAGTRELGCTMDNPGIREPIGVCCERDRCEPTLENHFHRPAVNSNCHSLYYRTWAL